MPAIQSTWFVGSRVWGAAIDVTIDASAEQIAAGTYFLRSATAAESLLAQVVTAMTAAGVADPTAVINQAGYVVLGSSGTFTVTWTDSTLRDVLGFTGNLSGASSYTADYQSELWWSPGYVATRPVVNGKKGYDANDTRTHYSRDGTQQVTVSHHTRVFDEMRFDAVWHTRVWYSDSDSDVEKGGTYLRFRDRVWVFNRSFDIYLEVTENSSSSTAVTWPTALGRYKRRELPSSHPPRKSPNMQTLWNLEIELHLWE